MRNLVILLSLLLTTPVLPAAHGLAIEAKTASSIRFVEFNDEADARGDQATVAEAGFDYTEITGVFKNIPNGAIVEGSVGHGGLQPNYIIDTETNAMRKVLDFASSLKLFPQSDRIRVLIKYIRNKTMIDRRQTGEPYLDLLAQYRRQGQNIPLSSYLETQVGVCREHALLLHLALKEAGVPSRFVYGSVKVIGEPLDHAFVVVIAEDGTKYIADAYNLYLNGRKLNDLTRAGGSRFTDDTAPYNTLYNTTAVSLLGIHIKLLNFPKAWKPSATRLREAQNR